MTGGELDEALEAARRAEDWAIACLFRSMQPQLLRYLTRRAPSMAEDLASEPWLAVAQNLAQFEGSISEFRALLFTIARRRVVDHYRKQGRRPKLTTLYDVAERPDPDDAAEIAVGQLSAQQAVDALVKTLPPDQAEAVLLRVVADLSVEQVARVMDRSPGAVRVLQHRALRRLAKHFHREDVTN